MVRFDLGPLLQGQTKIAKLKSGYNLLFIALIHPIQWTIAYPVGADRPAKRQKKTSCVSTGQAGPVLCTRQMACRTFFLSRQRDVIASFSFGACECTRILNLILKFIFYGGYFCFGTF